MWKHNFGQNLKLLSADVTLEIRLRSQKTNYYKVQTMNLSKLGENPPTGS